MQPNLDELQQAMLMQQQASGRLSGLNEQYQQADALRNKEVDPRNGLGSIATVMRRGQARNKLAEIEPQRAQARQQIAAGEASTKNEGLRQSIEKEKREQARLGIDQQTLELNQLKEKNAQENAMLEFGLKKALQDKADAGGRTDDGKHLTGNFIEKKFQDIDTMTTLRTLSQTFDPAYTQVISGIGTRGFNQFLHSASKSDVLKMIPGLGDKLDDKIRDGAINWWDTYQQFYELPERNDKFGSALTTHELKAWADAHGVVKGGDPEAVKKALDTMTHIYTKYLTSDLKGIMAGATAKDYRKFSAKLEGVGDGDPVLRLDDRGLPMVPEGFNEFEDQLLRRQTEEAGFEPKPKLEVGTVEDGYEYIGGPPGNPESWKKKE